jgi:hypothetical protein
MRQKLVNSPPPPPVRITYSSVANFVSDVRNVEIRLVPEPSSVVSSLCVSVISWFLILLEISVGTNSGFYGEGHELSNSLAVIFLTVPTTQIYCI